MKKIKACHDNIKIAGEVWDFIDYVRDVGEESITDYLMWQWKKLNNKFNYLSVDKHTRIKENSISGADFELELWILHRGRNTSFVFQAKKLIDNYNSYRNKLDYTPRKKTTRQIDTLINYAKTKNKLPFYIFYSQPNSTTKPKCNFTIANNALFMTDAYTVLNIISSCTPRTRLSKNNILNQTNPFHCLFCCPLSIDNISSYISAYFPNINENHNLDNQETPNYVYQIADEQVGDVDSLIKENDLNIFRNIAVLDLRDKK